MELILPPNPLFEEEQTFSLNKVALLIGENGSGKSSILHSIYKDGITNDAFPFPILVGFSSGQNESFSSVFKSNIKRMGWNRNYTANYFYDNTWAKLLIFLACGLETSRVKSFLEEKGYVEDFFQSAELTFKFCVRQSYVDKVQKARLQELEGYSDTLLQSSFHKKLCVFLEQFADQHSYNFDQSLPKLEVVLDSDLAGSPLDEFDLAEAYEQFNDADADLEYVTGLFDELDWEIEDNPKNALISLAVELAEIEAISRTYKNELLKRIKQSTKLTKLEKEVRQLLATHKARLEHKQQKAKAIADQKISAVLFYTEAALNNRFIDKKSMVLKFGDLNLESLSDGEYQLLFIMSLLDLFDSQSTLFLLDEVDSHLHYKNIERLWQELHNIKGHVVTTSHLIDSIAAEQNTLSHLKVVEHGEVHQAGKSRQLLERVKSLSRIATFELEVIAKYSHIVVMDDYNDWMIFTLLAQRKGHDIDPLVKISPIKLSSGYDNISQDFAETKIQFLQALSQIESKVSLQLCFLICDRDDAAIKFAEDGVSVPDRKKKKIIKDINWKKAAPDVHLLAWQRREIKNYLLSYTVLRKKRVLGKVNNKYLAANDHLEKGLPGDNAGIRNLNCKSVINQLINTDGVALEKDKLQRYINLIPPSEISEDISRMYGFIIEKMGIAEQKCHRKKKSKKS